MEEKPEIVDSESRDAIKSYISEQCRTLTGSGGYRAGEYFSLVRMWNHFIPNEEFPEELAL